MDVWRTRTGLHSPQQRPLLPPVARSRLTMTRAFLVEEIQKIVQIIFLWNLSECTLYWKWYIKWEEHCWNETKELGQVWTESWPDGGNSDIFCWVSRHHNCAGKWHKSSCFFLESLANFKIKFSAKFLQKYTYFFTASCFTQRTAEPAAPPGLSN